MTDPRQQTPFDPRRTAKTPAWRRYARFFGANPAADVDDELRFHLESRTADLIERGWAPDAARAEARRQFGEVGEVRALCETWGQTRVRRRDRLEYWAGWLQDVRYGARTLRRDLGFAAVAVAILACGMGSTAAIISVVDGLLVRPLPIGEPSRVVWVDNLVKEGELASSPTTGANTFLAWSRDNRSFERLAAYMSFFGYLGCNLTADGASPERLGIVPVTEQFFAALGVAPALGRAFVAEEMEPLDRLVAGNAPRTVILTDRFWRRRFSADAGIVGRTLTLNGQPSRVVGVVPARFDFPGLFAPGAQVDLFTPLLLDANAERMGGMLAVIGRLRPGVSAAAAQSELSAMARAQPASWNRAAVIRASPLHDHVALGIARPLLVLAAAVGLVLLMVCVNIATLQLGRANARRREMAVRAALGASRLRLLRQGLTESLLLAGLGAALGLPLALAGVRAINGLQDSRLPLTGVVALDARVLLLVGALTIVTALLFGLWPAWRATSLPAGALGDASRGSSGGRDQRWTRQVLVVAQLAFACVLLVGAGLLLRSFVRLMEIDRGFRGEQVTTGRLDLGESYGESNRLGALVSQVRQQLSAAGAAAVGFTDALPLDRNRDWSVRVPGEPDRNVTAMVAMISPGYLEALGVPVVAGRLFSDADHADGERVVLVGRTLARRLWNGADPIDRIVEVGRGRRHRVVGVVGDLRTEALDQAPGPQIYFLLVQNPSRSLDLVVRAPADTSSVRRLMTDAVRSVDPAQPIGRLRTMDDLVATSVSPRRFLLWLIGGFAAMALVLASLGIYGVIAHGVTQRRREIGIRLALGATAGGVQRGVLAQAVWLALGGLALGSSAALALGQTLSTLLYGVSSSDLTTHATVAALLLVVAALAGYLPSRRAARVDPTVALRAE
jgi:predicted permease